MSEDKHGEAFRLMTYQADDGSEEETVWNSRDGVTPFVITLRSGKQAKHINWHQDRRVPDYQPAPGTRIFVDLTEERAREIAHANAERFFAGEIGDMARRQYVTVEAVTDALFKEYMHPGAPDLVEVPEPVAEPESAAPAPLDADLVAAIDALQDEIIKESLAIVEESCAETGVTLSDVERDIAELGAVAGIRAAFRVLYRKGLMVGAGEAG